MILPTVVTFFGMYLLGETLWNKHAGLVCAVAAALAPYRAVDLFVRGALSEVWGMMALPWAVVGAIWVIKGKKWGTYIFILGLVAMLLSHNLTALVFALTVPIVVTGYLLLFGKNKVKASISLFGCAITALLLCAFYIFPAVLEQKYTNISEITEGYFDYANHFVYIKQLIKPYWGYGNSGPWSYNDMSYFLGYGQLIGAVAACLTLLVAFIRKKFQFFRAKSAVFGGLLIVVTLVPLLMMNARSQPIWSAFPVLSMLQFPWRWLLVATFLVALLSGFAVSQVQKKVQQNIFVSILIFVILAGNFQFFRPKAYLADDNQYYGTEPAQIREQMKYALPEYNPETASNLSVVPVSEMARFSEGFGTITVVGNKVHTKQIVVNSPNQAVIEFLTVDFPGWKVLVDGEQVPLSLSANGSIMAAVPAGKHTVEIKFTATPVRAVSDSISFLMLLAVCITFFFSFDHNKNILNKVRRHLKFV
jgi:hypothetical protein